MSLPIEISNYIQSFLRPIEGLRIIENQQFKNKDHLILINSIKFRKLNELNQTQFKSLLFVSVKLHEAPSHNS